MSLPQGWYPLERPQSLNLETELHRELASTHQLYGRQLRAVARRGGRDDILFVAADGSGPVYCVHLTWSVEKNPEWPWTTIYRDAGDFLERWPREELDDGSGDDAG